jgi:DNA adenine methylase
MSDQLALFGLDLGAGRALTPPLKWAGGKTWQVPHVRPLWMPHRHRRWVEPFCGGLGMTCGLRPESALLNDINAPLVNFYRWAQAGLSVDGVEMRNDEALFYANRARFNQLVTTRRGDTAEAAGLFYFLNRTCFNGLCRFNGRGEFNVPFGKYEQINYRDDFADCREALAAHEFTAGDFESMLIDADDFIYADPPYDVEFTEYAQGGFTWPDQVRVAEWLARHPGPVVLSNQATERIVRMYERLGFDLRPLDAPRRISASGDRTPAKEVLATLNLEREQRS